MQYRINLAAANWRIEKLNEILPELQDKFEEALNRGSLLELEPADVSWINDRLAVDDEASS